MDRHFFPTIKANQLAHKMLLKRGIKPLKSFCNKWTQATEGEEESKIVALPFKTNGRTTVIVIVGMFKPLSGFVSKQAYP